MKTIQNKPRNKSITARVNEDVKKDCTNLASQHSLSESMLINIVLENHLQDFDLRYKKMALEYVTKLQEIVNFEIKEINSLLRKKTKNSNDSLDNQIECLKNYDLLSQLRKLKSLLNV